ncbi:prepilin-type N-terminal cleavage/methylation domain-containing protein [bacterium]|nr:prepilin-type N-terminal cleavage/methylation domain-containing protein [candidate division CSSED10-310 bacterium]
MNIDKKIAGFTLLELMISMIILATALMGILPFFFHSQAQLKQATLTGLAMTLIQEKMERIIQLDYDLIHYMDAPFFPDLTTQYTFVLPEVFMSPCTDVTPNPCGYQSASNLLVDVVERQGYFFTRTVDIDCMSQLGSLELPEDQGTHPTGLYLPNDDTIGVTIQVQWRIPGGERFVRSSTLVFDNSDFQLGF